MSSLLLMSQKVITEYQGRIDAILKTAPGKLELLPFTPALQLTPAQVAGIEVHSSSWRGESMVD